MTGPNHRLGECPNGVEWCDPEDHLCEDCAADWTDHVYEELRDRELWTHGPNDPEPPVQQ